MTTERTIKIVRSFSRTVQIEDYQPASFFSSRDREVPVSTPMKEQQEIAKELFALAMTDVMDSMGAYAELKGSFGKGLPVAEFAKLRNAIGDGESLDVETYIDQMAKATGEQKRTLNHFKNYAKRSK